MKGPKHLRRFAFSVLCLLFVVQGVAAQSDIKGKEPVLATASLSGSIRLEGLPAIGGLVVVVHSASTERARFETEPDDRGRFSFANLPPGRYWVRIESSTLSGGSSLHGVGSTRRLVHLTSNEEISGFDLDVPKPCTISGRILDREGMPIAGARAVAMHYISGARDSLVVAQSAEAIADERGAYRIHSLAPGRYSVQISGPQSRQLFGSATQRKTSQLYQPVFYPDSETGESAVFISLRPGSEVGGIDVRLRLTEARIVRGEVQASPQALAKGTLKVTLEGITTKFSQTAMLVGRAAFAFQHVPAGRYRIVLHGEDDLGNPNSSFQEVDVSKEDVVSLKVHPQTGVFVDGLIRVTPPGSFPIADARPWLLPLFSGIYARAVLGEAVDSKGRFKIGPVAPGPHMFRMQGIPDNCYEDRLLAGTVETTGGTANVEAGLSLQADIVCDAGELHGVVVGADEKPAPGAVVALRRLGSSRGHYFTRDTDQNAEFRITGLHPGAYEVMALDALDASCLVDAFCLEPYRAKALTTEVRVGEAKRVTLTASAFVL